VGVAGMKTYQIKRVTDNAYKVFVCTESLIIWRFCFVYKRYEMSKVQDVIN